MFNAMGFIQTARFVDNPWFGRTEIEERSISSRHLFTQTRQAFEGIINRTVSDFVTGFRKIPPSIAGSFTGNSERSAKTCIVLEYGIIFREKKLSITILKSREIDLLRNGTSERLCRTVGDKAVQARNLTRFCAPVNKIGLLCQLNMMIRVINPPRIPKIEGSSSQCSLFSDAKLSQYLVRVEHLVCALWNRC
jgi:hypothetical protein